jgi:hypothetical protein
MRLRLHPACQEAITVYIRDPLSVKRRASDVDSLTPPLEKGDEGGFCK